MDKFRFQGRGPTSSAKKNEQIRQFSEEFRALYARASALGIAFNDLSTLVSLDAQSTSALVQDMRARVNALSSTGEAKFIPLSAATLVVDDHQIPVKADGTAVNFPLAMDVRSGTASLNGSYSSKVRTIATVGDIQQVVVHPEVECKYEYLGTLESASDVLNAVDGNQSTAFLVEGQDLSNSAPLLYYVRIPTRSVGTEMTNVIDVTLAPLFYCNLMGVQYTTDAWPTLTSSDNWKDIEVTEDETNALYYPPQLDDANPVNSLYAQKDFGSRRYCMNEERVTAVRFVVGPRTDGSNVPVPLKVDAVDKLVFGIRDMDAGHVSYSGTGTMAWELTLPEATTHIDSVTARLTNTRYTGVYNPKIDVYVEQSPGLWTLIDLGEVGADIGETTKIRVNVTLDIVNKTVSPILAGFDVSYR